MFTCTLTWTWQFEVSAMCLLYHISGSSEWAHFEMTSRPVMDQEFKAACHEMHRIDWWVEDDDDIDIVTSR